MCGEYEYQKLRKNLEWSLDRSLSDVMKENAKKKSESGKEMKDLMDQLFEVMDRLQENMKAVAHRLEPLKIPSVQEKESEFGPITDFHKFMAMLSSYDEMTRKSTPQRTLRDSECQTNSLTPKRLALLKASRS